MITPNDYSFAERFLIKRDVFNKQINHLFIERTVFIRPDSYQVYIKRTLTIKKRRRNGFLTGAS